MVTVICKQTNDQRLEHQLGQRRCLGYAKNQILAVCLKINLLKQSGTIPLPLARPHLCSFPFIGSSCIGAGSIMESLALQKPLIVVINEVLMNNHQTELARQLHKEGHLLYTTIR